MRLVSSYPICGLIYKRYVLEAVEVGGVAVGLEHVLVADVFLH